MENLSNFYAQYTFYLDMNIRVNLNPIENTKNIQLIKRSFIVFMYLRAVKFVAFVVIQKMKFLINTVNSSKVWCERERENGGLVLTFRIEC